MPVAQKNIHIISEIIAILLIVPLLLYVASQTDKEIAFILYTIAISTLFIDGYLLSQYKSWNN